MKAILLAAGLAVAPAPRAVPVSAPVAASQPTQWYESGLALEEAGTLSSARQAFDLYRKAAAQGLAEAQFNVAVMLDSGRGTSRDVNEAALWYGRAAAHGFARAAYNLAQLYEAGEGVPRNEELAREWYEASRLPAARGRPLLRDRPAASVTAPVASPTPSYRTCALGCELVWVSGSQPSETRFVVEVRRAAEPDSLVFSGALSVSSMLFVSSQAGTLVWRVSAINDRTRVYSSSPWQLLARPSSSRRP